MSFQAASNHEASLIADIVLNVSATMERKLGRAATQTASAMQAVQRKVVLQRLEIFAREDDESPFSGLEETYYYSGYDYHQKTGSWLVESLSGIQCVRSPAALHPPSRLFAPHEVWGVSCSLHFNHHWAINLRSVLKAAMEGERMKKYIEVKDAARGIGEPNTECVDKARQLPKTIFSFRDAEGGDLAGMQAALSDAARFPHLLVDEVDTPMSKFLSTQRVTMKFANKINSHLGLSQIHPPSARDTIEKQAKQHKLLNDSYVMSKLRETAHWKLDLGMSDEAILERLREEVEDFAVPYHIPAIYKYGDDIFVKINSGSAHGSVKVKAAYCVQWGPA